MFENEQFAVVVKPSGVHVNGRSQRTVEDALSAVLQRTHANDSTDQVLRLPHCAHRLDYRVGGLLLIAKHRKYLVHFSQQFENRQVSKSYRAILVGKLVLESGEAIEETKAAVLN